MDVGFRMKKNYKGESSKVVCAKFSGPSWAREELFGRQRRDNIVEPVDWIVEFPWNGWTNR